MNSVDGSSFVKGWCAVGFVPTGCWKGTFVGSNNWGDTWCNKTDGSVLFSLDNTPLLVGDVDQQTVVLNLGNHRCQCKVHDYCRELCLLYFVMCFLEYALISTSDGEYLPPLHQAAIWRACASCYYTYFFVLVTQLY